VWGLLPNPQKKTVYLQQDAGIMPTPTTTRFWADAPAAFLLDADGYAQFVPNATMTQPEQLNALLRLSIYFSLATFVFRGDPRIFVVPIAMAALTMMALHGRPRKESFVRQPHAAAGEAPTRMEKCTPPTVDNPFMNVSSAEYGQGDRPLACDPLRPATKRRIAKAFEEGLVRDVGDVYAKQASDRQFYTNPVTTVVNDQEAFAKWLYTTGPTCKERNGEQCYQNIHRGLTV
jgi:hypothetical protein